MSTAEIIAQLPKLSSVERRRLADPIFELEAEAQLLHDCDTRANENFAILDAMEAENSSTETR
jgi:hypothetical protein